MQNTLFVFIIVAGPDSDASSELIISAVEAELIEKNIEFKAEVKNGLPIIAVTQPPFRFYIILARNTSEWLNDCETLARDAQLPWDKKPIDNQMLTNIFEKHEGTKLNKLHLPIAQIIYAKICEFQNVTIYCIPSAGRSKLFGLF